MRDPHFDGSKLKTCILSIPECEARVSTKREGRISTQCEVRVFNKKCETHIQPKAMLERDVRVSHQKCDSHV